MRGHCFPPHPYRLCLCLHRQGLQDRHLLGNRGQDNVFCNFSLMKRVERRTQTLNVPIFFALGFEFMDREMHEGLFEVEVVLVAGYL